MSDYKVAVGPYQTGPIRELTFYDSWTIDRNLDDGCTFSFTIPGASEEAQAISELDTDVWLYRAGILTQRFRIIQVSQTWGPSEEDVVQVQAVCYRRLLGARYVQSPLTFSQVSQGQLIWELIQHTQAQPGGDLGITAGDLGPTVLRDRSYEVGENILDIITNLTNVIGGPTWDIDQNLQLVVSRADLYPTNPAPIVIGATASSLQRPSGAALFANSVLATGNNDVVAPVSKDSATILTDPRGRWERRASYPSVVLPQTLEDHAYGLLTDLQAPTTVWDVEVVPERYFSDAQYKIGDFVKIVQPATIVAPIGQPAIEVDGQVLTLQVRQDAAGGTRISMKVLQIGEPEFEIVGAFSDTTAYGWRTVVWRDPGAIIMTRQQLPIEYLVVGGGGGGGSGDRGGGGGAGGLKTNVGGSPLMLPPGFHPIIVGRGGSGGVYATEQNGERGGDSALSNIIMVSGGGGGGNSQKAKPYISDVALSGSSGANGGGASGITNDTPPAITWFPIGGSNVVGEGNIGGSTFDTGSTRSTGGAGGGGYSEAGQLRNTGDTNGGKGGDGIRSDITQSVIYYAGGGGGGRQGYTNGKGGFGGADGATAAVDRTGGGGGGSNLFSGNGFDGGDGIVVVRWAVGTTPTPKATGGDRIFFDNGNWVHIFENSGTFAPSEALTVDYLIVGGGGGGGFDRGGGGGAGGYREGSTSITAIPYTITVGAGGAAATSGNQSSAFSLNAAGGGRGGSGASSNTSAAGGSGGGGAGYTGNTAGANGNTPSTSPSQGNNGGAGAAVLNGPAGGGGGAGGVGGNGVSGVGAGAGGLAKSSSISGISTAYAQGGQGARSDRNGFGGGVRFADITPVAAANTGGGGGGWSAATSPVNSGGKGIVIVRYPA